MKKLILVFVVALISQSCATMFSGTNYTANISATRPNSEIFVDGKSKGFDDVKVRYKRKKEMQIDVVSEGKTTEFQVLKTIKWGSQVANLLNWVYWIPLGTIIDAASGGIWQPEHKHVDEVTKISNKVFDIKIKN